MATIAPRAFTCELFPLPEFCPANENITHELCVRYTVKNEAPPKANAADSLGEQYKSLVQQFKHMTLTNKKSFCLDRCSTDLPVLDEKDPNWNWGRRYNQTHVSDIIRQGKEVENPPQYDFNMAGLPPKNVWNPPDFIIIIIYILYFFISLIIIITKEKI